MSASPPRRRRTASQLGRQDGAPYREQRRLAIDDAALDAPSPSTGWWGALDALDHELSVRLASAPRAIELALLLPASLFQPFLVPLLLTAACLLAPARAFAELAAGTVLTLAATSACKARIGRVRPGPRPQIRRRSCNLRALESNHAMPSGDAAQAALWALLLVRNGHSPLLLLLPPLTCVGRVVYGCHWLGDVVAGALVGVAVGAGVHAALGAACQAAAAGAAAPAIAAMC